VRRLLVHWRVLGAAALAGGVLALAACGGSSSGSGGVEGDLANGKQKFTVTCGSCHQLQAAGTKGLQTIVVTSGKEKGRSVPVPNLDNAFRGARQQGFKESEFQGVVEDWIKNAEPPMPRDLLTGKDAQDVAAYVASVAGRSPESTVEATPKPQAPPAYVRGN
jgi:mono/diheme cytochrome c family protein